MAVNPLDLLVALSNVRPLSINFQGRLVHDPSSPHWQLQFSGNAILNDTQDIDPVPTTQQQRDPRRRPNNTPSEDNHINVQQHRKATQRLAPSRLTKYVMNPEHTETKYYRVVPSGLAWMGVCQTKGNHCRTESCPSQLEACLQLQVMLGERPLTIMQRDYTITVLFVRAFFQNHVACTLITTYTVA